MARMGEWVDLEGFSVTEGRGVETPEVRGEADDKDSPSNKEEESCDSESEEQSSIAMSIDSGPFNTAWSWGDISAS